MKTLRRLGCALGLVSLLTGGSTFGQPVQPDAFLTEVVQSERGLLEWHFKGQKLFVYSFGSNQFKPYVGEFRSLAGENVLRDAPSDHLHHHGLMYAIRVNDVNFWEERDQPGHERHLQFLVHETGRSPNGLPQATFTELIHWLPQIDSTNTTPLLVERRRLTLTVDEANAEIAMAWHADFEVGARTNRIKLHGSDYNGLGLRLPADWDLVAQHHNSENAPYLTGGTHDVFPARWSTVSRSSEGHAAQVVLCAAPRQAGTNMFFAMTKPFTYLAVTQGLDKAPLEYRAGDRFSLDYLLLVYSAAVTPTQLETRCQAWVTELK